MGFLHNTALKKWASEIFEQNVNNSKPIDKVNDFVQPVVNLEPKIITKDLLNYGTIFTTPTDKDFWLTNVAIELMIEIGNASGNAYVEWTNEDGTTSKLMLHSPNTVDPISEYQSGTMNSNSVNFPFRGVLLKRGTNIVNGGTGASQLHGFIAGYYGSDRSGN